MQKKIIVLAIAAALAPALAFADSGNVVVYGQANVSYDMVDTGDGASPATPATAGTNSNRVVSNSSRIGVKGSEDLGGGLSAIWQLEGTVDVDTGTSSLFNRNTFGGISSASLGTLTLGNNDTPYKASTRKLDVFADGVADNRSLLGAKGAFTALSALTSSASLTTIVNALAGSGSVVAFDGRSSDLVTYTTPNFNGFTGAVAYSNRAESNTLDTDSKQSTWSLSGTYDVAPFYAALAYEKHKFEPNVGTGMEETATRLGLGYSVAAFDLGLVYQQTDDDVNNGSNLLGRTAYSLSAKYNISATDAVKVAYTNLAELDMIANTGATQMSIGFDHAMSKRTTVYALYTKLSNDQLASFSLYGSDNNANLGTEPSAFSLGMKHSF